MKIHSVTFFLFFQCWSSLAQNLVPNQSFEANIGCPSAVSQISNIISWTDLASHTGNADYFHTCGTSANITVPNNYVGSEPAAAGNAYIGLNLIYYPTPDFREYVEIGLSSALTAGATYSVSFQYSLADNSDYNTSDFGIYFSATANAGVGTSAPMPIVPQVTSPVLLDNKVGWITVTENFVASGGEQFMLLGNFLNDALTTVNAVGNAGYDGSYIYLDDIVVQEICNFSLGNDTVICTGQTIPLDATTINNPSTYLWQDSSTDPTFTVTGPGIYWVEVTNVCGTTTDSIVVDAASPLNLDFGNDTILCLGETWLLDVTSPNSTYVWQDNSTNSTFNVSQQGTYYVDITNTCESVSDTIEVGYLVALNVNLGNDVVLCPGDMMTLDATSPISTYLWQDNSTSPTYSVSQPGTYSVQVFSNCDTANASITIDYFDPNGSIFGEDTVICQGDMFTLDATSPNATYFWHNDSTYATFDVDQQGSYWVDLTNNCGTVSDTINVSYLQSLVIDLGSDTMLCDGEDLTLGIPQLNVNYLWQNNATTNSITVNSPGLYYVDVGVAGCAISDSILVSFQEVNAEYTYLSTTSGCPKINEVNFTDQSTVSSGSIENYIWSFSDGTTVISPNPSKMFSTFGNYEVGLQVISNLGCSDFVDGMVSIDEYDEIDANFSQSPLKGVANETSIEFNNSSTNATFWLWDFGDGNTSNEENPSHVYANAGIYQVTLISGNGVDCNDSSKRTLGINEQIQVFVPNAFTPGNGGPNDNWTFSILGVDVYNFTLTVYNRWGELIWESHDPNSSWNGKYNGEIVFPGTYVWKMEINNTTTAKGESFYGTVNVLK
ncbi:MAG: PKD domain-containing protein [Crocinitomicaceae bacterium]